MFTVNRVFPGVAHITDAMGVSMTLIGGEKEALLFDAGYGTEDVRAFAGTLTDRPVRLLLSHGHHDHILGARWFERCSLCREDLEEYRLRTGAAQREAVKGQAEGKGLSVPEDFLTAPVPDPDHRSVRSLAGSPVQQGGRGGVSRIDGCRQHASFLLSR